MKFGQCGIRTLIRLLHLCAYCCFCYSFLHLVFSLQIIWKWSFFFFFCDGTNAREKDDFKNHPSSQTSEGPLVVDTHVCFAVISSEPGLVLLPPVGLASLCWHFAVICTLQSGPFFPHQKCFYARVSGCLWCLPSAAVREREQGLCSGAEGGKAALCPERF